MRLRVKPTNVAEPENARLKVVIIYILQMVMNYILQLRS